MFAPGLEPAYHVDAVRLFRIGSFSTATAGLAAMRSALLYSNQRFAVPAFYQASVNLFTVAGAFLLWRIAGIYGFALGYERRASRRVLSDNRAMPAAKPAPPIYELKITLLDIAPPIWRRLQVPATIKLSCLHSALQVTMGWTDSHLHQWERDGKYWGVPEWDEFKESDLIDEKAVPLKEMLKAAGESVTYLYDFGDDWRHEIVLEKIIPSDGPTKPVCLAGERRCPPEDVGGPHGYQEFLETVFDPKHEEFEHYRQWAGNPVHAEEFDLKAVNRKLSRMRWPVRHTW